MRNIAFIFSLIVLFVSCKKEQYDIVNLNGNKIDALGHGGMGIEDLYPINSFESIINCLNLGSTGSEIDVQMTSDSILVAFHNADLSPSTDMSGVIHSHTWNEIQSARYNSTLFNSFALMRIDDLFSALDNHNQYRFTFDIKLYSESMNTNAYYETFTDAIITLFDVYSLDDNVFIESQSKDFLSMLQNKKNNYSLYHYPQTFDEGLSVAQELGIKGISISSENISAEQVQDAHDNGFYVNIWGVLSKNDHHDAILKNPDMIQSDKVEYLIDLLKD